MRFIFWILLVVSIIVIIYSKIKLISSKINFSPNFKSLNISSISLPDLLKLNSTTDLQVELSVSNDNNFSITFSNLKVWIYYKNSLIAQSLQLPDDKNKKMYLMANSSNQFNQIIRLELTRPTLDLYAAMKSGDSNNSTIQYIVSISIFGIPLKFNGDYNTLK